MVISTTTINMKRIILAIVLFMSLSTYSQVYINGKKVAESGASDISIVNGDVYIDGKYIDELTESVEDPVEELEDEESVDPNLYQTENVDAYNKWYNSKGKMIIEKNNKKTKNTFLWIFGSLGAVTLFITLCFVYAEIKKRIQKKISQRVPSEKIQKLPKENKPKIPAPKWSSPLHHDMDLPEVSSPIKPRQTRL